jgi:hypothetical protein
LPWFILPPEIEQEEGFFVRKPLVVTALCCTWALVALGSASQSNAQFNSATGSPVAQDAAEFQPLSSSAFSVSGSALPEPPAPSPAGREQPFTPPGMEEHYGFLSRMSIGSGISAFGILAQGTVILSEYADARVDSGWFFYNTGGIKVNGFDVVGDFHMATLGAKLDWYPTKSMWRISPGMLFYDGNRISGTLDLTGGTSFSVNGKEFWSATANPATGATPLTGTVNLGLHSHTPAFTISGGFGKFIPHSHRHWSFPTEFGVAFAGPPTLDVKLAGWVCTSKRQTRCGDIADPTNPVGIEFQNSLDAALVKWRHNLDYVHIYPIISTSFMYSFDLPGGR